LGIGMVVQQHFPRLASGVSVEENCWLGAGALPWKNSKVERGNGLARGGFMRDACVFGLRSSGSGLPQGKQKAWKSQKAVVFCSSRFLILG